MASRTLLDRWIWCPWSGSIIDGEKIKPHKIQVVVCANKTLFSMCTLCRMRAFTSNWNMIAKIMKTTEALEVTQKPLLKRSRK